MRNKSKGLSRFWKEVKKRNIHLSLAIYTGTAFIILEACSLIFPRWGLPDRSIDLVLWLLIIGLFINLIISHDKPISKIHVLKPNPPGSNVRPS